jgi:cell division protein ZapA
MINRVRIEILGAGYTIATPESEEYVRSLATELDEQVRQLMEADVKLSLNEALILCAISYADSYRKSEGSSDHMARS